MTKPFLLGIGATLFFGGIAVFGYQSVTSVTVPGNDFQLLTTVPANADVRPVAAPKSVKKSPAKITRDKPPAVASIKEVFVASSVPVVATSATPVSVMVASTPEPSVSTSTPTPAVIPEPQSEPAASTVAAEPQSTGLAITEVMAGSQQSGDDEFIELYNGTGRDILLTGFSIKKKASSGNESSLVSVSRLQGKIIPAGKHFLIVHEGKYSGDVTPDVTWPASYSLAYTNNAVVLYGPNAEKLAELSWLEIPKGQSSASPVPMPQNSSQ